MTVKLSNYYYMKPFKCVQTMINVKLNYKYYIAILEAISLSANK